MLNKVLSVCLSVWKEGRREEGRREDGRQVIRSVGRKGGEIGSKVRSLMVGKVGG